MTSFSLFFGRKKKVFANRFEKNKKNKIKVIHEDIKDADGGRRRQSMRDLAIKQKILTRRSEDQVKYN